MESTLQATLDSAWATIAADKDLRVLMWHLIAEDCEVFNASFSTNATAYCQLAKQEIGKRYLERLKVESLKAAHEAEAEYEQLLGVDRMNRKKVIGGNDE